MSRIEPEPFRVGIVENKRKERWVGPYPVFHDFRPQPDGVITLDNHVAPAELMMEYPVVAGNVPIGTEPVAMPPIPSVVDRFQWAGLGLVRGAWNKLEKGGQRQIVDQAQGGRGIIQIIDETTATLPTYEFVAIVCLGVNGQGWRVGVGPSSGR